jgi:hypothetical protein
MNDDKKMSRPVIPIDWKIVDQFLEYGCPGTEIAALFGMHPETLYRRTQQEQGIGFTEYSAKKKSKGDAYIRQAQYLKAIGKKEGQGDNVMLIWLGKQRLGQTDAPPEQIVHAEIDKRFSAVMNQLSQLQSGDKSVISLSAEAPKPKQCNQ